MTLKLAFRSRRHVAVWCAIRGRGDGHGSDRGEDVLPQFVGTPPQPRAVRPVAHFV
jgi:hypothetical protein